MKSLTIPRRDLTALALLFTRNANPPRDPSDDETAWRKFKYACGKNWQHCQSLIEETQRLQQDIKGAIPGYADYQAAEELVLDRYVEKDEKGAPVFEKRNDEAFPVLRAGVQGDFERDILALETSEQFAPVLAAVKAQAAAINAVLDLEVTVILHTVPWNTIPSRVSGTYSAELCVMLSDIPPEFDAKTPPLVVLDA